MNVSSQPRPADAACYASDGYLLQAEGDLADAVTYAVQRSAAVGASGAIALVSEQGGINITVTNGKVENAVRDGNQSLRVTLFDNGRTGTASTEALSRGAIDRVVEQAIAMARQLEPDLDAGPAPSQALAWQTPAVPLFAPSDHNAADLTDAALAIEAAALATPTAHAIRVSQAGAASQDMRFALATSEGFCRTGSGSFQQRWCQTIAQRGEEMKASHWASIDRRVEGLEAAEAIGRRAAERASEMIGAEGLGTRRAPVLVDATIAASLVGDLCGQLTGNAQYRRMTFLPDAMGQRIAAEHLTLVEDPFEPFGLASATFDSEGIAGTRRAVVRDGVVDGLFLDIRMARKLGHASTGNASGLRNLHFTSSHTDPGDDLPAMLRKMGSGLWLTRFMGGGVNPATGAFSRAAAGFWVEAGQVVKPVQGITIAGNLQDMLKAIVAIGADVYRDGGIRVGSILLPDLQIAGR